MQRRQGMFCITACFEIQVVVVDISRAEEWDWANQLRQHLINLGSYHLAYDERAVWPYWDASGLLVLQFSDARIKSVSV